MQTEAPIYNASVYKVSDLTPAERTALAQNRAEALALALDAGEDPDALIARLVAGYGAKYTTSRAATPDRLTCLGIATSCTYGAHGLLRNWIAAVWRKTGKAVA
ncbi:hypothetical protein [Rhodobacter sp. TJ_12]|uniref:hypothetical protein n=1 Tax=Rhodobacter sp. TJ_12 TaxID=2029399 RepID=UPI001CBA7B3F|nr:hypothetical protein [Rhodobacter sp. TJ_12]